jgi:GNAT superfamily N-acetyltransferase
MSAPPARLARMQRLEEIGFATWPAFERERYDGWELRATAGVTRRANSVNPVDRSTLPLTEKIAYSEEWFSDRSQPAVFRLTELADPELDAELDRRGYQRLSPTDTMVAPVVEIDMPAGLRIERHVSDEWFAAFCSWNGRDPELADPLRALLESIPCASAYISADRDDRIAAVGLAVFADDHVGIYNMNTDPAHRRSGLATKVLRGLVCFGAARGAEVAFLQVLQDNDGARALYAGAGFETLYPYWYRERV